MKRAKRDRNGEGDARKKKLVKKNQISTTKQLLTKFR